MTVKLNLNSSLRASAANSPTATQPGTERRGEGILRMEDATTSEEDDDIDSHDSNIPIDHGHIARNCSIKIITPAVKASVISNTCFLLLDNFSRPIDLKIIIMARIVR